MTRFEKDTSRLLYGAVVGSLGAVFLADWFLKLGIAVWIFYLVPVALSIYLWNRKAPFYVATAATLLITIDFFLGQSSEYVVLARINRGFGIATVWIMAGIGHLFIRNKLAVRKEEWLQVGLAELSAKVAGDKSVHQIAEETIGFIANYVDAQVGVFFCKQDTEYRRMATYALSEESAFPSTFKPGQSLLGQAAKEGRIFVISDVPSDHVAVSSGTGRSRPRHLLIAPMKVDGMVNSMIELGFVRSVQDGDEEFLARVSETIGTAVRSAQYRGRLQELLEETQRQSEELQTQSEELRVSNEELQEQSNALKESQTRLELQQAELEQTNSQLEEQTQLLESQKEDLIRAKEELEDQSAKLQQASRYKSDFLANMSHELRTPLNSSLILAKLLADNRQGNLSPDQVQYAKTIQSAGNDLLALINDILDLSKIEAGRMEVHSESVNVPRLLKTLHGVFDPIANQKGLAFRTETAPGAPDQLETDSQRLEQVLKNLLSNAMKFTEKGEVVLAIGRHSPGTLAFAVRDTGIGIAEDQQQIIFEPFCQADGTTNRKYGGTGLGLSISRELARLLGGEIQLTSEPGKGSTFTVVIPEIYDSAAIQQASQAPEPAAVVAPTKSTAVSGNRSVGQNKPATKRPERVPDDREKLNGASRLILIVEDDAKFSPILRDLAREMEFQTLIAGTGEEGLALAQQYQPSAILLDVGLPDSSGLLVLDALKRDVRTRHIPVHVVSANDYTNKALSLGAVGYMLKPVKREQLIEAFENLESRLTRKMRKVLLVEDDAVQLDSLRKLLGSNDVETVGVTSAASCLDELKKSTFDCMVLDLSLPDASGFALLETLTTQDSYSFPPVIVYTGRELLGEEEQRLRRFSKSIIIKGAKSPERLLDEVTLFLHQTVSDLPAEHQRMIERARDRDEVLENRRILIVEDDVRNVFALTSYLEPKGVNIEIARNGREALRMLEAATSDPARAIDLVLMDIMMPEMDGLTAMKEIRKNPAWKKLPIIALTAKAMRNDQEECISAGASDYMSKPLDVERLTSLLRVWMPR